MRVLPRAVKEHWTMEIRRVPRWWKSRSVPLRHAAVALWTLGLLTGLGGIVGDRHGWWANQPFATNLLSAVTTASFGIPLALLVLQDLAAAQARASEREA